MSVKEVENVETLRKLEGVPFEIKKEKEVPIGRRIAYLTSMCKLSEKCRPGGCDYHRTFNGNYYCIKSNIR